MCLGDNEQDGVMKKTTRCEELLTESEIWHQINRSIEDPDYVLESDVSSDKLKTILTAVVSILRAKPELWTGEL